MMIEFKNINKTYHKNVIYDDLNLLVEKNDFIIITGTNGSGKSTFIKLLLRQINQTSGSINVNTKKIAYIPESYILAQNVKVGVFLKSYLKYIDKDVRNVNMYLDKFGIAKFKNTMIKNLSKGTKQKLTLSLAYAKEAELLVLDEPISGLDSENQQLMIDFIKQNISDGVTVVLATHFLDLYDDFNYKRTFEIKSKKLIELV